MLPQFAQYSRDLGGELVCPGCGGTLLHHEKIEVFDRSEDKSDGLHVVVAQRELRADTSLLGNPSPRRDGLVIHLSCESCDVRSQLCILQHKGQTYVDLRSGRS